MMDCTDRHFRRLMRFITKKTWLYSEMLTPNAILFGDRERLLGHAAAEIPLALQLGGSDPDELAKAAAVGVAWGYDEINLNIGCPSARVQSGAFGACLMKDKARVAACYRAVAEVVSVPVTIKTRVGVDHHDSDAFLFDFVDTVAEAGCQIFIFHARIAWLQGLSPKENRTVPPLNYSRVARLKARYPNLHVSLNGGITTEEAVRTQLETFDGVMIGRAAYANPYLLAFVDQACYGTDAPALSQQAVVESYYEYAARHYAAGEPLRPLVKPLIGLFQGLPKAKHWRRALSAGITPESKPEAILSALDKMRGVGE